MLSPPFPPLHHWSSHKSKCYAPPREIPPPPRCHTPDLTPPHPDLPSYSGHFFNVSGVVLQLTGVMFSLTFCLGVSPSQPLLLTPFPLPNKTCLGCESPGTADQEESMFHRSNIQAVICFFQTIPAGSIFTQILSKIHLL